MFLVTTLFYFHFTFAIKFCWILVLHLSIFFLFFLFHDLDFGLSLQFFLSWFKKSRKLGCFHARDNLNKLPLGQILLFFSCYPFVSKSCLHPWKKSLLCLGILNMKIKHYMNLLLICKSTKLQPLWDVFPQHNPNQKNHGSTYLTSLIAHVQSFEVLSTKCVWSFDFILIDIQLA